MRQDVENNVIEYYVQVKPKRPQFYDAILLINDWTLKPKRPQSYNTLLLVNVWLENETRHRNNVIEFYITFKSNRNGPKHITLFYYVEVKSKPTQ